MVIYVAEFLGSRLVVQLNGLNFVAVLVRSLRIRYTPLLVVLLYKIRSLEANDVVMVGSG